MDTISKDYVFKEVGGQFKYIGNFNGLYRDVEDPWSQQCGQSHKPNRLALIKDLSELQPKSILDVGCGLGHLTQAAKTLITDDVLGVDISKVCVERATQLFPDTKFQVLDIRNSLPDRTFEVIILNGILWYMLKDLDAVVDKIANSFTDGGYLIFVQAFISNQRYAKDIIDGYSGLIERIQSYKQFDLQKTVCFEKDGRTDSIITLRKKR